MCAFRPSAANESLVSLDLSWNKIRPGGGVAICAALKVDIRMFYFINILCAVLKGGKVHYGGLLIVPLPTVHVCRLPQMYERIVDLRVTVDYNRRTLR